jgi:putative Mn2+ efflux pump MntP
MDVVSIFLISVGLAMDAFAVAVSSGLAIKNLRIAHALRISLFFGFFQGLMPVMGWLAGLSVKGFIADVAHWAAFGIMCFIGGKMIYGAAVMERAEREASMHGLLVLLGLSVATSLDALAVGVTFALLNISIITPAVVIGFVTFFMSYSGVCIGKRFGHFSEKKIEILGGLILIAIGLKIVIQNW